MKRKVRCSSLQQCPSQKQGLCRRPRLRLPHPRRDMWTAYLTTMTMTMLMRLRMEVLDQRRFRCARRRTGRLLLPERPRLLRVRACPILGLARLGLLRPLRQTSRGRRLRVPPLVRSWSVPSIPSHDSCLRALFTVAVHYLFTVAVHSLFTVAVRSLSTVAVRSLSTVAVRSLSTVAVRLEASETGRSS